MIQLAFQFVNFFTPSLALILLSFQSLVNQSRIDNDLRIVDGIIGFIIESRT